MGRIAAEGPEAPTKAHPDTADATTPEPAPTSSPVAAVSRSMRAARSLAGAAKVLGTARRACVFAAESYDVQSLLTLNTVRERATCLQCGVHHERRHHR